MTDLTRYIRDPGPKPVITGRRAVCSSDNTIVTETIMRVLGDGGNAADAAIAGALVQAVVEPFMTNPAGSVSLLYREAAGGQSGGGRFHQLHASGTFPAHLAPCRPTPPTEGGLGRMPPACCIPGFMPGLKALHERFATRSWQSLCAPAVAWAESGHAVSSFEYGAVLGELDFLSYHPEGRRFFLPDGRLRPVSSLFRNEDLARTMRALAGEGPDHMIGGAWARRFVETANRMGWPIELADMAATPPRWIEPMRFSHVRHDIVSLAAPEQQGAFLQMVLGILRESGIRDIEPQSAEHLWLMAHALRLGLYFCGFVGDPNVAPFDMAQLCDGDFHRSLARLVQGLRPHADLSEHVRLTQRPVARTDGHGLAGAPASAARSKQPAGSCELSVVDAEGNWLQLMNTLQGGGIPGMVVDGVAMVGSHATFAGISGHFDAKLLPGARLRSIVGHAFLLEADEPVLGLGTPGNVYCTVPQVLTNLLDFGMSPADAVDAPRLLPLGEDGQLVIEDRISQPAVDGLARLGVGTSVMGAYDWHMGSFQVCFRDPQGRLGALADPRRCGEADGLF